MKNYLLFLQLIVTILLIVSILLQQRGQALGSAFGGETGAFYGTRRGIQKKIFEATILLGTLFIAISLLNLLI